MYFLTPPLVDLALQHFDHLPLAQGDNFFYNFGPGNLINATNKPHERFNDYEELLQRLRWADRYNRTKIMRYDITKWLIHFTRDRNPGQDFIGATEEEASFYAGGELEDDSDAFEVLKTIIRLGGLLPGHSFRGGKTTIYGGQPAICITEMPIYSFAKYVQKRNMKDKVSAYGIAVLKNEFYLAGGRPVIYGLANDQFEYEVNTNYKRIIKKQRLPLEEQFRYVAYNPVGTRWVDWSHEREWRWIPKDNIKHCVWCRDGNDQYGFGPGLPIFNGIENGGYFSRIAIIVWTVEEAKQVQEMLTGFYLAGHNNYDSIFSRNTIYESFIIILDQVIDSVESGKFLEAQTIEGLINGELYNSLLIHNDTKMYNDAVKNAINEAKLSALKAAEIYLISHDINSGYCGRAYVVSENVTNPVIQYLISIGIARGPYDGLAVLYVDGDWQGSQSLDYNECIADAMCAIFNNYFGDIFFTQSRSD